MMSEDRETFIRTLQDEIQELFERLASVKKEVRANVEDVADSVARVDGIASTDVKDLLAALRAQTDGLDDSMNKMTDNLSTLCEKLDELLEDE